MLLSHLLNIYQLTLIVLMKEDMVVLVSSVLVTFLRRDMSLNRRLFTWLLGTEINPSLLPNCHPLAKESR